MRKALLLVALTVAAAALLTACAAGVNPSLDASATGGEPAGFWWGLWHGVIAPVTFIVSLFRDDVNIYEVYNNGNWYDAGFMLGISMIFGSGPGARGAGRASRRRR